jgi:hypothetical protein
MVTLTTAMALALIARAHAGIGAQPVVVADAVVDVAHRNAVAGQVLELGEEAALDPRVVRG